MKTKKKSVKPEQQTRFESVTFQNPGFRIRDLAYFSEPTCFNSIVSYRKWRVVAEMVDEPEVILKARLLDLWRRCDNYHHCAPLREAAAKHGLDLPMDQFGLDRPKQK